jgi:hypothetical protein
MGAGSLARPHGVVMGPTAGADAVRCPGELRLVCPDGTFSVGADAGVTRAIPSVVPIRFRLPPRARVPMLWKVDAPAPAPMALVTDAGLEVAWATATEPPAVVKRTDTHTATFHVLTGPVYSWLLTCTTRAKTPIQ